MKDRNTFVFVGIAFLLAIGIASSATQTWHPSAKAAVQFSDLTLIEYEEADHGPETILWTGLKTGNQKDLLIGLSTECGLYTFTNVRSKGGEWDTSSAYADVELTVYVDGEEAKPGPVTFCRRDQELSAKFQGILEAYDLNATKCEIPDTDPVEYDLNCLWEQCLVYDGQKLYLNESCLTDEELNLTLETLNANHFTFVAPDVGSGFHTVTVNASIDIETTKQKGETIGKALIGKGTLTVEEIRLVKDQICMDINDPGCEA
jgi:hypothetical protein